ncbi:MAG: hypothetical protein K2O52_03715, partial [Oscillospiraceae bacterium]|nr:hypothetical protein [Oscillospiraceae bacterium]
MKSHLKSTIALSTILVMSMLSVSCGTPKITEYETKHPSGTYIIATFEDIENLTFPKYTSLETVVRNFTDFCYYNYADDSSVTYAAYIPVDMSEFFESEVVYDPEGSDSEPQSFPDFVESKKIEAEEDGEEYEDIGDGANAELYVYFNADKEISSWELHPNIDCVDYFSLFNTTLSKRFTFFSDNREVKKIPVEIEGKTYDWPYIEGNIHFTNENGDIGLHVNG